jgi:hypothetical protein
MIRKKNIEKMSETNGVLLRIKNGLFYFADNLLEMFLGAENAEELTYAKECNKLRWFALTIFTVIASFLLFLIVYLITPSPIELYVKNDSNNIPSTKTEINWNHLEKSKSNYYNIEKINNRELVKGFVGEYYIIDLKVKQNPEDLIFTNSVDTANMVYKIFHFEIGKYYFDRESISQYYQFVNSFDKFINDLIDPFLRQKGYYHIFLRGKADKLKFTRNPPLHFIYNYDRIEVVKYLPNERINYDLDRTYIHKLENRFSNEDLPDLRAMFVKDFVINDELHNLTPPKILEGIVTENIKPEDRNIEIIIFLKR